jgi:hypothetical protein
VYWKTLNDNGVTKERMRSYDRQICSEPNLRPDQKDGLIRDLTNYLRTLKVCRKTQCRLFSVYEFYRIEILAIVRSKTVKNRLSCEFRCCHISISVTALSMLDMWQAVHSGADLESAIQACMGYTAQVGPHCSVLDLYLKVKFLSSLFVR